MKQYTIHLFNNDNRLKLWPAQKLDFPALMDRLAKTLTLTQDHVARVVTKAVTILFSNRGVYKVTVVRDHLKVVVVWPRKVIYDLVDDTEMLPDDWLSEGMVYVYLFNTGSADYINTHKGEIKGLNKVSGYNAGFYTEAINLAYL